MLELVRRSAAFRGNLEEMHAKLAAARDAGASGMHEAKVVDGHQMALLCGNAELLERAPVVPRCAQPIEVHQPEIELRFGQAQRRRLLELLRYVICSPSQQATRTANAAW